MHSPAAPVSALQASVLQISALQTLAHRVAVRVAVLAHQPIPPAETMKASLTIHLDRLLQWIPLQPHMRLLLVSYNELISDADREVLRIREFLDGYPEAIGMLEAIDPSLYRNRCAGG